MAEIESVVGDPELITRARVGDREAFGELYRRHARAATNLARQYARGTAADDLVSEAFARVLDGLNAGRGPDVAFRAYLFTTLRNTAYDRTRRDSRLTFTDDDRAIDVTATDVDTVLRDTENWLVGAAYQSLPERWQAVLWYLTVEGYSPAQTGELLGLSPNAVTSLAYRAREGLRESYLQAHLAGTEPERCREVVGNLGSWTRDGLSRRERAVVDDHLATCDDCRALAAELAEVNSGMRALLAPVLLGGAALGYLALLGPATTIAKVGLLTGAAGSGGNGVGGGSGAAGGGSGAGVAVGAAAGAAAVGAGVGGALGLLTRVPKVWAIGGGVTAAAAAVVVAVMIAINSGSDGPGSAADGAPGVASSAAGATDGSNGGTGGTDVPGGPGAPGDPGATGGPGASGTVTGADGSTGSAASTGLPTGSGLFRGGTISIPSPGLTPGGTGAPITGDTGALDPNATDPNATDPNAIDPDGTGPDGTDPNGVDPGGTDPDSPTGRNSFGSDPNGADPNGPGATEPNSSTDPNGTDSSPTETGATGTDPAPTKTGTTDPTATEPGTTAPDPSTALAPTTDPGITDPTPTDPGTTAPNPPDPPLGVDINVAAAVTELDLDDGTLTVTVPITVSAEVATGRSISIPVTADVVVVQSITVNSDAQGLRSDRAFTAAELPGCTSTTDGQVCPIPTMVKASTSITVTFVITDALTSFTIDWSGEVAAISLPITLPDRAVTVRAATDTAPLPAGISQDVTLRVTTGLGTRLSMISVAEAGEGFTVSASTSGSPCPADPTRTGYLRCTVSPALIGYTVTVAVRPAPATAPGDVELPVVIGSQKQSVALAVTPSSVTVDAPEPVVAGGYGDVTVGAGWDLRGVDFDGTISVDREVDGALLTAPQGCTEEKAEILCPAAALPGQGSRFGATIGVSPSVDVATVQLHITLRDADDRPVAEGSPTLVITPRDPEEPLPVGNVTGAGITGAALGVSCVGGGDPDPSKPTTCLSVPASATLVWARLTWTSPDRTPVGDVTLTSAGIAVPTSTGPDDVALPGPVPLTTRSRSVDAAALQATFADSADPTVRSATVRVGGTGQVGGWSLVVAWNVPDRPEVDILVDDTPVRLGAGQSFDVPARTVAFLYDFDPRKNQLLNWINSLRVGSKDSYAFEGQLQSVSGARLFRKTADSRISQCTTTAQCDQVNAPQGGLVIGPRLLPPGPVVTTRRAGHEQG